MLAQVCLTCIHCKNLVSWEVLSPFFPVEETSLKTWNTQSRVIQLPRGTGSAGWLSVPLPHPPNLWACECEGPLTFLPQGTLSDSGPRTCVVSLYPRDTEGLVLTEYVMGPEVLSKDEHDVLPGSQTLFEALSTYYLTPSVLWLSMWGAALWSPPFYS